MAESISHALKMDKNIKPEEISVDYEWLAKEAEKEVEVKRIGFNK